MKKYLLSIIIILFLSLCACSNNNSENNEIKKDKQEETTKNKTEYTMKELNNELAKLYKLIDEETEYLTEEERLNGEYDIDDSIFKKVDLPYGKEIELRGKVHDVNVSSSQVVTLSLCSVENNDDYDSALNPVLYCEFKNATELVWLEENNNIVIKGFFSSDYAYMNNCEIISADIEIPAYKNNIEDVAKDIAKDKDENYLIINKNYEINGEVYSVIDISDSSTKEQVAENFPINEYNKYSLFENYIDYSDYLIFVKSENDKYMVALFTDIKFNENDKIMASLDLTIDFYADDSALVYGWLYDKYYIFE